jgi:hypothetical protein
MTAASTEALACTGVAWSRDAVEVEARISPKRVLLSG